MTVYAVNKLVNKSLLNSLKEYLKVDKVTICYSDIFNSFACKTNTIIYDKDKKLRVNNFLWDKLKLLPIEELSNCPKVEKKKRV